MTTLSLRSFHSVRGGVGRSALSFAEATGAARRGENAYLIEMGLGGGISLVDSLAIEPAARGVKGRRFLNDFILQDVTHFDELIRLRTSEGVTVIPASPFPEDVYKIESVICEEQTSAYIEGRLEYLLALIATRGDATVVFDCPRGFHGLSRVVVSLGLRFTATPKMPLAEDGYLPPPLDETTVDWHGYLLYKNPVDRQGIERWLERFTAEESRYVSIVEPMACLEAARAIQRR